MVQVVGALASAVRVGDLTILLPVHELISPPPDGSIERSHQDEHYHRLDCGMFFVF